eukprot:scaffold310_cov307-Pinguiococcus_pyrenoidosus.AAC.4
MALWRCSSHDAFPILGAKINVYGRMLSIVDFADETTRRKLQGDGERLGLVVQENLKRQIGAIVKVCESFGLRISKLRMVKEDGEQRIIGELFGARGGVQKDLEAALLQGFGAGTAVLPEYPEIEDTGSTASYDSTTCAVILPHVVKRGFVGDILDDLASQGFDLGALGMFSVGQEDARRFLEVYQGVLTDFRHVVDELCSGPCVALELGSEDAVKALREAVGPWDVEIAKEIRPHTLRAKYGVDSVRKAIHCTDLPEDSASECRFFFETMWRSGRLS